MLENNRYYHSWPIIAAHTKTESQLNERRILHVQGRVSNMNRLLDTTSPIPTQVDNIGGLQMYSP